MLGRQYDYKIKILRQNFFFYDRDSYSHENGLKIKCSDLNHIIDEDFEKAMSKIVKKSDELNNYKENIHNDCKKIIQSIKSDNLLNRQHNFKIKILSDNKFFYAGDRYLHATGIEIQCSDFYYMLDEDFENAIIKIMDKINDFNNYKEAIFNNCNKIIQEIKY